MQHWIGIEKSPDSTLVVFSRFYSSPLEVEMDLHPVDFRVSELVPLLHCSSCPLAASQGGHFEAARKELMKMLKVGSTTSGSHKWKNSHMQAKMIHESYDARS